MDIHVEEQPADISRSPHRPLHWYADDSCYWVTAATYQHLTQFNEDDLSFLCDEIRSVASDTDIELSGWTILPDHYHLIAKVNEGRSLARFGAQFHSRTSRLLNKRHRCEGRKVWRQYWDTLLRSDGDFWSRMNYMWWNPVRHGYVEKPEDWHWTNLHAVMMDEAPEVVAARQRFPAPRRLPNDDL